MKPTIVLLNKYGQLGNRLYVYARFISLALEWDARLLHRGFAEYAMFFEGTVGRLAIPFPSEGVRWPTTLVRFVEVILEKLRGKGILPPIKVDRSICWGDYERGVAIPTAAELRSEFQNHRIWRVHEELLFADVQTSLHYAEIQRFFRLVPSLQTRLDSIMDQAREPGAIVVGVHLRRGDYRGFAGGKYFYSDQQYAQVMRSVVALFSQEVRFLLVSNEEYDQREFEPFHWIAGDGHMAVDCYSLASCDYIIGPQSTFSGWASFYGSVPLYWIYDPTHELSLVDFTVRRDL